MATDSEPRPQTPWQARLPFYYGWLIVGLGFFSAIFSVGLIWATSIFAVPMQADLGWSRSSIFFAVSLRGWMGIAITPLIGGYLDARHGVRILALIGGLLNALSLILISGVEAQWQFILLFGVLGGVAQACQAGIAVTVAKWFIRKRGMAVSVSTMGGGLAALVMPQLLTTLDGLVGWRGSWLVLGVLAFLFTALPVLILRRQPEDIGLLPDGDKEPAAQGGGGPRREEEVSFTRREAVRTKTFWILMVGVAVGALAANGIPVSFVNIFVDRGLAVDTAATALVAYGIASMTAKIAWGWLANRLHLRVVLLLLTAYGMLAIPSILLVPNSVGSPALAYGFVIGFYVGAYIPLHGLVWATYFGRAHLGAINGVGRPLSAALLSGGPFILASSRDAFGSYTVGLLIATAAVAIAFLAMYVVRPPRPPSEDRRSEVSGGAGAAQAAPASESQADGPI